VRNTDVKAAIKVSGKPQILGTCSPQTPESIDIKFASDDRSITLCPSKMISAVLDALLGRPYTAV